VAALLGCAPDATDPDSDGKGRSGNGAPVGTGGMTGGGHAGAATGSGGAAGMTLPGTGGQMATTGTGGTAAHGSGGANAGGSGGNSSVPDGGAGTDGSMQSGTDAGDAAVPEPVVYPKLEASLVGDPVRIANSFTLAESPVWDPCGHQILFTDVTASVIHTLSSDDQIGMFASNTGNANGIAFDIDGSLILAQMGGSPGHIARRAKDGMITVLEPAGGPRLHTPDDVTVRSDGTIYFSDGNFYPIGTLLGFDDVLPVYSLAPGATDLVKHSTVSGPNGIELSPDEKTLYLDAFGAGTIETFSVATDGTLTAGAPFAFGLDSPDSLCLDAAGNVYVGVKTGLLVLRADGTEVTLIPAYNSSGTTSCGFGGDDGKTLYITAWTSIWKVENMPIPGADWLVNQKRVKCN
jgi:gluconolactonase